MTYYNYHAIAKRLINDNCCIACTIFKTYHHITPAMVLYFTCHRPIPIREYMWDEYLPLLKEKGVNITKID